MPSCLDFYISLEFKKVCNFVFPFNLPDSRRLFDWTQSNKTQIFFNFTMLSICIYNSCKYFLSGNSQAYNTKVIFCNFTVI